MLNVKNLLNKIMVAIGYDYPAGTTLAGDASSAYSNSYYVIDSTYSSYNSKGVHSRVGRTSEVGTSAGTNADSGGFAWRITDLGTKWANVSTTVLKKYSSIEDASTTVTSVGWEFVELWGKITYTFTRAAGMTTYYKGYSSSSTSSTTEADAVMWGRLDYADQVFPLPSSFFGGSGPACVSGVPNAADTCMRAILVASTSGTNTYSMRICTSMTSASSSSTAVYTCPVFMYMFFMRSKGQGSTTLTSYINGSNVEMTTSPATSGKTVYYYNNWNGPEGAITWNLMATLTTDSSGKVSSSVVYQAGDKILTNYPYLAGTTDTPGSAYWYIRPGETKEVTNF